MIEKGKGVRRISLEQEAEMVCESSSVPPLIFQVPPRQGRQVLDNLQNSPVYKYPGKTLHLTLDLKRWGRVKLYVIVPDNLSEIPNVTYYIHGGGWVFGNLHTHEKLVREIAARTNSVVFFPEYSLSPEAKYPTAIEQCYAIMNLLPDIAARNGWTLNFDTLTVAGDSVGGNMATVMTILSKYRKGIEIHKQLLYYPVTNARFDTESYRKFGSDYYLYRAGMIWFWNQYTMSEKERSEITASPLRASREQLKGLPPAMILNGEADVLQDEGEAYARKLRAAGVDVTAVRFQAMIHDFVMLHALDQSKACRAAMNASVDWINQKNMETV